MNFKQLNLSQNIFSLVIIAFTITNNINSASQAHVQSSSSASSGSFGDWLKSWFVSAPTEQQKKIAAIVGERSTERQKKLADVLYDATLLPEDLIKIIIVYDERVFSQHSGPITALVVLSHGRIASASDDKTIKIWDIEGDRCLRTLEGHTDKVTALAALENDHLASGAHDSSIRIWNLNNGIRRTLVIDKPDTWLPGIYNCITDLAPLPNNKLASSIYSPCRLGRIIIWDLATEKPILTISSLGNVLVSLPNGKLAAAIREGESERENSYHIIFLDSTSGIVLQRIDRAHRFDITALSVLANGKLISGSCDHEIKIWNLQSGKEINSYSPYNFLWRIGPGAPIFIAPLSNNQLASGWGDKKIRIIDLNTMQCIRTLEGHTGAVTAVAALPNGKLASGSEDGTIRIWNLEQEEHKE